MKKKLISSTLALVVALGCTAGCVEAAPTEKEEHFEEESVAESGQNHGDGE